MGEKCYHKLLAPEDFGILDWKLAFSSYSIISGSYSHLLCLHSHTVTFSLTLFLLISCGSYPSQCSWTFFMAKHGAWWHLIIWAVVWHRKILIFTHRSSGILYRVYFSLTFFFLTKKSTHCSLNLILNDNDYTWKTWERYSKNGYPTIIYVYKKIIRVEHKKCHHSVYSIFIKQW